MKTDFLSELEDRVYHDVMACIGCNDCLLACPLEESKAVTIAELNQAALDESITSANVVDFVTSCTQCQQCVPVCPADLRRADIVLWNQMKVQTVAPDKVVGIQAGEQIVDSTWTVDTLAQHLSKLAVFEGVGPDSLRRLLLGVTLRRLATGELLVRQGQYYERLLVVIDGALEQSSVLSSGETERILTLGPGTFHGYMGVMGGTHEPFDVAARLQATIIELTKPSFLRLMAESPAFDSRMQSLYQDKALWTHLRASPLLSALTDDQAEALLEGSELKSLNPKQLLYGEGEDANAAYLVRSGFLRVARRFGSDERVLQYFREGDICGVSAVLFGRVHSATVTANTKAEVVEIPAAAISDVFRKNESARRRVLEDIQQTEALAAEVSERRSTKGRPSEHLMSLEGLVDDGVVQGKEVLVINTAICTNCNNCVDACGRRHERSRLDRSGLQMGDLLFPTACRHCEDPVCLLCSVSGIVREPDGEIRIVTDNCIGCGACAERCPYGNINMHPRKPKRSNPISSLLGLLLGEDGDDDIHASGVEGDRVAVKCDLCFGYDDYACVTACPVGAAMRVDPVEAFGRTDLVVGLEKDEVGAS